MLDRLSYPGLRCVLEYLEANKRIHITARSPVLQKFEKSIPLHLDYLFLDNICTHLNDVSYSFITLPGVHLFIAKGTKHLKIRISEGIEKDEAFNTMKHHFLDGRNDIYVNQFCGWSFEFPANLQLKIRKLDTDVYSFCGRSLEVIHTSSFPLMELRTGITSVEDLNHDILKSAAKLFIFNIDQSDESWLIPRLADLNNSEIVIGAMYPSIPKVLRIIKNDLRKPRCIGACLTFCSMHNEMFLKVLSVVKDKLNGRDAIIMKHVEGLTPHTPCAIPINSTSAALFYGLSNMYSEKVVDAKIEIVPIDAFTSSQ